MYKTTILNLLDEYNYMLGVYLAGSEIKRLVCCNYGKALRPLHSARRNESRVF